MNILQDIKTAASIFGEVRKARKRGANAVQIEPVYSVPCVTLKPAYRNTVEGCQTWKLGLDADRAVMEIFKSLPYETQRRLEFSPEKPGEWAERTRFWQQQLKPALPPKMYHDVMILFVGWYIHCLRLRKEATARHIHQCQAVHRGHESAVWFQHSDAQEDV